MGRNAPPRSVSHTLSMFHCVTATYLHFDLWPREPMPPKGGACDSHLCPRALDCRWVCQVFMLGSQIVRSRPSTVTNSSCSMRTITSML